LVFFPSKEGKYFPTITPDSEDWPAFVQAVEAGEAKMDPNWKAGTWKRVEFDNSELLWNLEFQEGKF